MKVEILPLLRWLVDRIPESGVVKYHGGPCYPQIKHDLAMSIVAGTTVDLSAAELNRVLGVIPAPFGAAAPDRKLDDLIDAIKLKNARAGEIMELRRAIDSVQAHVNAIDATQEAGSKAFDQRISNLEGRFGKGDDAAMAQAVHALSPYADADGFFCNKHFHRDGRVTPLEPTAPYGRHVDGRPLTEADVLERARNIEALKSAATYTPLCAHEWLPIDGWNQCCTKCTMTRLTYVRPAGWLGKRDDGSQREPAPLSPAGQRVVDNAAKLARLRPDIGRFGR